MTNAHYHRGGLTCLSFRGVEYRFFGVHPWSAETVDSRVAAEEVRRHVSGSTKAGVGEIGLDRLRTKCVTPTQRELFLLQLRIASDMRRPVVLHGAKCWGEVVKMVKPFIPDIPALLFHGFSRSDGLLPEIYAMNGFVSVGKAVLNDHAVNYRRMVSGIPTDRLLIETDDEVEDDGQRAELLAQVFAKTAELTGVTEEQIDANAERLMSCIGGGFALYAEL